MLLQDQHNNIAKFLEAKGMPEQALQVATDTGAPPVRWVCSCIGGCFPDPVCVQQTLASWHAACR